MVPIATAINLAIGAQFINLRARSGDRNRKKEGHRPIFREWHMETLERSPDGMVKCGLFDDSPEIYHDRF
jgi:hypothetical protein